MIRKSSTSTLIAAGFLILAILITALLWLPTRDNTQILKENLTTKNTELTQINTQVASLVDLEANLPVSEVERQRILAKVPIALNQDQLVKDISAIANSVGISLNSVTFALSPSEQKEQANVVNMVANFAGDYNNLIALLEAIERNNRLLKVSSIGVQLGETSDEGKQQMNFSVSLESYYQ
ncbi:MAG: hypothetical protein UT55_C0068G0011 [Candidatus Peregrinibacteria bacterium GW2011_GWE2_39_6]|nr:MAG: hypothetical protein UT36_C0006G0053 [Candidatus Peregrinibacteria bacterium GW2011_GWF2_39_17]KKR24230.1 MAG: hypothetical protein UT55_C0068G0011 [Candidatus Peregrinibacteria bacterium GW2011_GWE2_39_6]HCW32785.1 hypothetical protein [Candidatus Peregrinibacteria bacterium]